MIFQNVKELPELDQMMAEGYIYTAYHPTAPLAIWNYTDKTQYTQAWNDTTMACRGLITDLDGNVVARPFAKFFNLDQVKALPDEPFEVFEKLDGCFLGNTKLNLWDGGTITIREVVNNKLPVTLIGKDEQGNVVPCEVVDWFDNGTKDNWILITVDCLVSKKSGARCGNNIPVTPNHHMWINGEFKPACEAKIGDMLSTYEDIPDSEVMHVIESSLLGDGCVSIIHNSFRYQELHTSAHIEYVDTIAKWLGECLGQRSTRTSGYGKPLGRVDSINIRALGALRSKWYVDGKKVIPTDLSWMDDFSVAKWYMDDGSLAHSTEQQDRANFATNGFCRSDVERLAIKLEQMYGVSCTVYEAKGTCLRVNAGRDKSINRLWSAIAPHVVPCMRYKLPEGYRDIPYQPRSGGKLVRSMVDAQILDIRNLPITGDGRGYFGAGRKGYDIKTTTGNYFCKGILVHNSLGIMYWIGDDPHIATRGSFTSDQAAWATQWLWEKMDSEPFNGSREYTYLFEIIAPENRIVVNYGERAELVLLAMVHTETGEEYDMHKFADISTFSLPQKYEGVTSLWSLAAMNKRNFEGFVVRFQSGLRVKVKMAEYVRLHKLVAGINEKYVLNALMNGDDLDTMIQGVPDELYGWVKDVASQFKARFAEIELKAMEILFDTVAKSRKEYAEAFAQSPYKFIMFSMLDNRNYDKLIWNMISS